MVSFSYTFQDYMGSFSYTFQVYVGSFSYTFQDYMGSFSYAFFILRLSFTRPVLTTMCHGGVSLTRPVLASLCGEFPLQEVLIREMGRTKY